MPNSNLNEIVDQRIIDLLGIGQLFDIDAEEYFTLLGERIQRSAFGSDKLSPEDLALLSNEKKRIRGERGSLKIVRKKITAESFKKKSSVENIDKINLGNQKVLVGDKTTDIGLSLENLSKNLLGGPLENSIVSIATAVNSILDTLKQQKKIADDQSAYDRRKKEQERRAGAEAKLEKRFEGLKKSIEKVLSPVKSILDRIIDFFLTMVVGRIIFKLIEWLGDKNNREKVQSLIRFFKDHWSKLLSLYIIFGTSFGKFARGLVSLIVKGSVRLAAATAGLLAKAGVKKAAGVAGFLGGKKGKLLAAGLETAAVVGGTMALTKGLENFGGIGGQQKPQEMAPPSEPTAEKSPPPEKAQPTEKTKPEPPGSTQRYSGGGQVKQTSIPAFSGGGLNIFKMIGDMGTGGPLMGPLRLILENVLQSKKSPKASLKPSSGDGKVKRVPAMVSDGEFIMSPSTVAKYGVGTMESMNAAGGGTNKPKIMTGTTYAVGGGQVKQTSIPAFSGGGLNVFKMIGDMGTGEPLMGPMKIIIENILKSKKLKEEFSENNNINSVPAMLNGGKYLMPRNAVSKYDNTTESINATGGQIHQDYISSLFGSESNVFKMIGDMSLSGPLMVPLRLILEHALQSKKSPKASLKPSSDVKKKGQSLTSGLEMILGGETKTSTKSLGDFGSRNIKRVPAMVSDGEFIMSPGAVAKYGVSTMETMNAAGGGNNKPKIMTGTTYAAGGGFIGKAAHHLKQDEALSSLSKGSNDFIKPGGKSIATGKPWSSLTSKTPVHSYVDSVGQPTIGWGSTYYDSILNGKKPVKMGDSITKEKADNILNTNILNLSNTYSKKIPTWTKMTDDQKAGVLLVGYNAPNGPIGSYPKLTNSLKIGDMTSAATNVQRGGPSASRISAERKLILSGPKDLSKSSAPKPTGTNQPTTKDKPKRPGIIQQVTSSVKNIFSNPFSKDEPKRDKGVKAYSSGGLVTEDTGVEIKGAGLDTQAALLREGEVVLVPGAVRELGLQNLMSLNKEHGGTNKPKTVNNFQFASGERIQNSSPNPILSLGNTGNYGNVSYASGNVARNFIPPATKSESSKVTVISKPNISAESSIIPSSQPYTPEEPKARRMAAPSLPSPEKTKPVKPIEIMGSTFGIPIGKGYPVTYKGREAIKVTIRAGDSYEPEINFNGKKFFAMKRGNDIIYVSHYAKGIAGQIDKFGAANESYKGRGGKLVGGSGLRETDKKNLPKTRIMTDDKGKPFVGHLSFLNGVPFYDRTKQREKGILENITNFFDPKGAKGREETLNARSIRMTSITDLEDFRKRGMTEENIKKQMGPRYKVAVNDLKARDKRIADQKAKVIPMNDWRKSGKAKVSNLGKDYKSQELQLTAKANAARISPVKPKLKNIKPPAGGSKVKVIRTGQTNVRGGGTKSGSSRPQNTVPSFKPTSRGASTKSQLMGISR